MGAHERSAESDEQKEWYTPRWVFDGLPICFDLDPCAALHYKTPARHHFTKEDDGLSQDWSPYGSVWLNPPYGKDIPAWLGKLVAHGDGMVLVFTRTDNGWFHAYPPQAIFFFKGRISFLDTETLRPRGSPGAPSMLLAYGDNCVRALENCTLEGTLFRYQAQRHSQNRLFFA